MRQPATVNDVVITQALFLEFSDFQVQVIVACCMQDNRIHYRRPSSGTMCQPRLNTLDAHLRSPSTHNQIILFA